MTVRMKKIIKKEENKNENKRKNKNKLGKNQKKGR